MDDKEIYNKYVGKSHFKGAHRGINYYFYCDRSIVIPRSRQPMLEFILYVGGDCVIDQYCFLFEISYKFMTDVSVDLHENFYQRGVKYVDHFINEVA